MTSEEIRESAMLGAPVWRGVALAPAIDHVTILERSLHPAMCGHPLDAFDAAAFLFVIAAPWGDVFTAAHAEAEGGGYRFDEIQWKLAVHGWAQSLDEPLSLGDLAAAQRAASLVYRQIKASGFKSIVRGREIRNEDDVGNSHAPDSRPGMWRGWPGLCILTPILFAGVCLILKGCS